MAKSTPIAAIRPAVANASTTTIQTDSADADDVVQDVLQSLNNETFTLPPEQTINYSSMAAAAYNTTQPSHPLNQHADEDRNDRVLPFAITHDIKLAAICMTVFIIVYQIPLEKIIYSYISLDKLPFSEVLVKGLIAGVAFYFISHLFS